MKPLHTLSRLALLVAAITFALLTSAPALADSHEAGETIKLGSDDLGKSREELGDRSLPKDDGAKMRGPHGRHGEKHGKHGKCDKENCPHKGECKECHDKKHRGKHKGKRRMGYARCVEKAVRGDIALDEAQRVCRAIFPERTRKPGMPGKPRAEGDRKRNEKADEAPRPEQE